MSASFSLSQTAQETFRALVSFKHLMASDQVDRRKSWKTVVSMQFVLARFYQNVREIVHERDEARRSGSVTLFVQPLAQLHQFIVNP
jgi:hypothetical protein